MQITLSPRARVRAGLVAALTAATLATTGLGATATAAVAPVASSVHVVAASKTTPTISGTVKVGSRLTAKPGTWPSGTTLTYAWKVAGTTVGTRKTFTPKASHRGKTLQLVVTGKRPGHAKVVRKSAKKTVAAGTFSAATPKISGTAKVGSTLKVTRGTWTPAPSSFAYRWYADGRAISGATGTSFKVTTAQLGDKITVKVTGKRAGYTTKTRASAATATVTRVAPRITDQPDNTYVLAGDTVRFSVTASGSGLSYQWQRRAFGEDVWKNLSGRTTSALSFTARAVDTLAEYRVVVKNSGGSATSKAAGLLVDSTESDPYPAETAYVGNYWLQMVSPTEAVNMGDGTTWLVAGVAACALSDDVSSTPYWDLYSRYRTSNGAWYTGTESDYGIDEDGCGVVVIEATVPTATARGGIWAITDWSGESEFGPTTQYVDGLN
ncbi:hypothetical protein ATJ88_2760 [Isoptericola jiangsuensis]|uniref:Ig-like domain-containing protein n=1 Tax=Isoptericola jiangsuensis TaxID=548579 RepID=A0A2A9EZ59_9MICO|nr:hypothetical protein [Isoptericola jiangsuensis]PFG44043.1 hypothetical protein ATJ88_2760 [Isoptericola jiangsuensis]